MHRWAYFCVLGFFAEQARNHHPSPPSHPGYIAKQAEPAPQVSLTCVMSPTKGVSL